ncbi:hypothetical protein ACFQ3Z_24455 [Streptomyces nogalater]
MAFVQSSGTTHPPFRQAADPVADGAFSTADLRRLDAVIHDARHASTAPASELLAPLRPDGTAAALTERECTFDHCAVLLFPDTLDAGLRHLAERGLAPLPAVPSTVVRARLGARHRLDPARCDVHITRLRIPLPDGRRHPAVEVFLFPATARRSTSASRRRSPRTASRTTPRSSSTAPPARCCAGSSPPGTPRRGCCGRAAATTRTRADRRDRP